MLCLPCSTATLDVTALPAKKSNAVEPSNDRVLTSRVMIAISICAAADDCASHDLCENAGSERTAVATGVRSGWGARGPRGDRRRRRDCKNGLLHRVSRVRGSAGRPHGDENTCPAAPVKEVLITRADSSLKGNTISPHWKGWCDGRRLHTTDGCGAGEDRAWTT